MNFIQAVQTCFKKYSTFSGRAPRSEYWFWVAFIVGISIITNTIDQALFPVTAPEGGGPFNTIAALGLLFPGIAVTTRRLHDINRSGWWQLLVITVVGIIPLVYWECKAGDAGENRFGPNPLA